MGVIFVYLAKISPTITFLLHSDCGTKNSNKSYVCSYFIPLFLDGFSFMLVYTYISLFYSWLDSKHYMIFNNQDLFLLYQFFYIHVFMILCCASFLVEVHLFFNLRKHCLRDNLFFTIFFGSCWFLIFVHEHYISVQVIVRHKICNYRYY